MNGNRFGRLFQVTTFGESHGEAMGCTISGCPAGLELSERDRIIAEQVVKEINARMGFLLDVGLDYLTLSRSAGTLAGGEAQRIRLASQLGSGLVGCTYVLDEPTIGLHPRDTSRLLADQHARCVIPRVEHAGQREIHRALRQQSVFVARTAQGKTPGQCREKRGYALLLILWHEIEMEVALQIRQVAAP